MARGFASAEIRRPGDRARAGFGEQVRPHLRQNRVAAGAQKETGAKPVFEEANLSANCAVGYVELGRGPREAAKPRGGFEGFDRIQGRQPRSGHAVSFSHNRCQNKSFVIEPSHRQMSSNSPYLLRR